MWRLRMNPNNNNWLIADLGATNSRCALLADGRISAIRTFMNDDAESGQSLLSAYIDTLPERPEHCALAVAAPVDGDSARMINRDWQFSRESIAGLGFNRIEIMNDFHAVAYALPTFGDESRIEIGSASNYRDGNLAVLGPGSGLGMSAWIDRCAAMCGEGGHITISGRNDEEDRIISWVRDRFGHCSAERLLSGPGLVNLHEAMHGTAVSSPEEITNNLDTAEKRATMQQFFLFLATVTAELALITGSLGGVYIAGGIVPACLDLIPHEAFRERFENKNRYRDYMRAIPTWVITDPVPGLTGLKAFIDLDRSGAR